MKAPLKIYKVVLGLVAFILFGLLIGDRVLGVQFGYVIDSQTTEYANNGTINATEIKGDNENALAIGVAGEANATSPLNIFRNEPTGYIATQAAVGNANISNATAFSVGVWIGGRDVNNLINAGKIEAVSLAGNATNSTYTEGVVAGGILVVGKVGNFTNSGEINVNATAGNALSENVYDYEVVGGGVYIKGNGSTNAVTNFVNSGKITVFAGTGNAIGTNSHIDIDELYGVYIGNGTEAFLNNGSVSMKVQAGNAAGRGSVVEANDIAGVLIEGPANQVVNSGNATVSVKVGSATKAEAEATAFAGGIGVYGDVGNFTNTNTGKISISASAGNALGTNSRVEAEAGGIGINNATYFENSGKVNVTALAGKASGESSQAYANAVGIANIEEEEGFNINNFINSGIISVKSQVGNADGKNSWVSSSATGITSGIHVIQSFTNTGNVTVSAIAGNATRDYSWVNSYAFGVPFYSRVTELDNGASSEYKFSNYGLISAVAKAESALGNHSMVTVSAYGAGAISENFGKISTSSTAGDAMDNSVVTSNAISVSYANYLDYLSNLNSISARALAGSAKGTGSSIEAVAKGIEGLEAFTHHIANSGSINATSITGNLEETNSNLHSMAKGIDIYGVVDEVINLGSISGYAKAGNVRGAYNPEVLVEASGVSIGSMGNFTNNGTISGISTFGNNNGGYGGGNVKASAFGVNTGYIIGNMNKFTNNNLISATAKVGNSTGGSQLIEAEARAIEIGGYVNNFTNTGLIRATSTGGNAGPASEISAKAYGVSNDASGIFVNSGRILSNATVGNAEIVNSWLWSQAYGVEIRSSVSDFINNNLISATASAGNASGFESFEWGVNAYGINIGNATNFSNFGRVSAVSTAGDALGHPSTIEANALGVNINNATNFSNYGTIFAKTTAGNAFGEGASVRGSAYGVNISRILGSFVNNGTISAIAQIGNAGNETTKNAEVDGTVYGVKIGYLGRDFNNRGTISASILGSTDKLVILLGNSLGEETLLNHRVYGIYLNKASRNVINSGNITARAEVGDVLGANATARVSEITGFYLRGGLGGKFINNGTINVIAKGGNNSEIRNISGIKVVNVPSGNIINNKRISIAIDAPNAKIVSPVAGIYVAGSNVTITNGGGIYLENNNSKANIRTLWIASGSSVTLKDKFAIVFGQNGVDRVRNRPIFVGPDSLLDLNNVNLIVKIRYTDKIEFNLPYYLIENKGRVQGVFNDTLIIGYSNPDIIVNWYDENRGANAALVFNYQPQKSVAGAGVSQALVTVSNLASEIGGEGISGGSIAGFVGDSNTKMFIYPFGLSSYSISLEDDRNLKGIIMGYESGIRGGYRLGLFGGSGSGEVDKKLFRVKEGVSGYNQGISVWGMYLEKDEFGSPWYMGIKALTYRVDNEYRGLTGFNYELTERGRFRVEGGDGRVEVGYKFENEGLKIRPYVGLGMSYFELKDYKSEVSDERWVRRVEGKRVAYGKAIMGFKGYKSWIKNDKEYYVRVDLRGEKVIGDNNIRFREELPGLNSGKVEIKSKVGDYMFMGKTEIGLKIKNRYEVNFSGGLEDNGFYKGYNGGLLFRIGF